MSKSLIEAKFRHNSREHIAAAGSTIDARTRLNLRRVVAGIIRTQRAAAAGDADSAMEYYRGLQTTFGLIASRGPAATDAMLKIVFEYPYSS